MRVKLLVCAVVVAAMMPVSALADDPFDPAMRNAAARARDKEIIRQLNLRELAAVRERDAGYAAGWRAQREAGNSAARETYVTQSRNHDDDVASYARRRAQYEQQMRAWRRAVAACQAGDYSRCDD
jgi:hypothetical protein